MGKTVRERKRWEIIASFPNLGDNCPRFFFSLCLCVRQLPEHRNAMANSIRRPVWGCFEKEERRREREERLPLFLPRQTCVVAAELSRGHTTHLASARIHRSPRSPSPPLHLPRSPPLTCQFLSRLPLANTVINLSVCLPRWQNQWAVLGAGVDTAAVYKARAT